VERIFERCIAPSRISLPLYTTPLHFRFFTLLATIIFHSFGSWLSTSLIVEPSSPNLLQIPRTSRTPHNGFRLRLARTNPHANCAALSTSRLRSSHYTVSRHLQSHCFRRPYMVYRLRNWQGVPQEEGPERKEGQAAWIHQTVVDLARRRGGYQASLEDDLDWPCFRTWKTLR
jgi:hypothetical protein